MAIFGYGEDSLTLWALQNKVNEIIGENIINPVIFFRPSFGRKGGSNSPEFGEFDFIIITEDKIFLGESKWTGSSEIKSSGEIKLKPNQMNRHLYLTVYLKALYKYGKKICNWDEFIKYVKKENLPINTPSKDTILANNLKTFLNKVFETQEKRIFDNRRRIRNKTAKVKNILLLLVENTKETSVQLPERVDIFQIVKFKYCTTLGNYIIL